MKPLSRALALTVIVNNVGKLVSQFFGIVPEMPKLIMFLQTSIEINKPKQPCYPSVHYISIADDWFLKTNSMRGERISHLPLSLFHLPICSRLWTPLMEERSDIYLTMDCDYVNIGPPNFSDKSLHKYRHLETEDRITRTLREHQHRSIRLVQSNWDLVEVPVPHLHSRAGR